MAFSLLEVQSVRLYNGNSNEVGLDVRTVLLLSRQIMEVDLQPHCSLYSRKEFPLQDGPNQPRRSQSGNVDSHEGIYASEACESLPCYCTWGLRSRLGVISITDKK
jgi:hypothetical protein